MASAETARLIASLELQDKFTPGINKANKALGGFERRTTTSFSRVGAGIGRAQGNLTKFAGSTAGLLGIGLGIAGVTAGISSVIEKTTDMAAATRNFAAITGTSVTVASQWVDVLDKFGITGDTAVKTYSRLLVNASKFTKTQKDATKFSKQYGLSLTDNKGNLVGANELLKRSADFFNSNATAAQKATTLTKLYGKGWQTLIPLLLKGRKGIDQEFGSALKLTPKQIKSMQQLLDVQRDWNDSLGDVQVKIGVALIPTLTKALKGLTTFFDQNSDQIVGFAQGMVKGAEELAGAIGGLAPIAKGIADAWNSIPADFRKLLLGGLVANKVLKMTIGFDPLDIARKAVTGAASGIFSRGSPANPMFTKEVGIGGVAGGPTAVPGKLAGIAGKVVQAVSVVAIATEALAVFKTWQDVNAQSTQQAINIQKQQADWLKKNPSRDDLQRGLDAVRTGIDQITSNPLLTLVQGEALDRLRAMDADLSEQIRKQDAATAQGKAIIGAVQGIGPAIRTGLNSGGIIGAVLALIPHIDNINLRVNGGGVTRTGTQQRQRSGRGGTDIVTVPKSGEGQNRGGTLANVRVNVNVSHNSLTKAAVTHGRMGPTPADAGAI